MDLKIEMETVKKENERILRAKEEMNQIIVEKVSNEEKDKQIKSDNTSYQHKSKRSKYYKMKSRYSSEINGNSYRNKHQYSSDSSDGNYLSMKKKYKPYEENSRELKKIKPPNINGQT